MKNTMRRINNEYLKYLVLKLNVHYAIRCIVKQISQDTSIVISVKRETKQQEDELRSNEINDLKKQLEDIRTQLNNNKSSP